MRWTPNHVDMLYRYALAAYYTSPSTPANYDRTAIILELEAAGLIEHVGMFVITASGRRELATRLDAERAEILRKLDARRATNQAARTKRSAT